MRLAAPDVVHLHVHDNWGRTVNLPFSVPYIYTAPFGVGDLHLPPGWGSIPYDAILADFPSPPVVLLMEIQPRYHDALPEAVAEARRLARLANGG